MSIGTRRSRIDIYETTYDDDTIGGQIPNSNLVKSTWAEVATDIGIRSQENRGVRNTQAVNFIIRSDSYAITTANTIVYGGNQFTIHSIQTDVPERFTTIIGWRQD